jgi:cell cycle sensor histidine kinase DivJ
LVISSARNAEAEGGLNHRLPRPVLTGLAGWMAGAVLVCLVASLIGAPLRAAALAAVLALAPALATLLLAPRSGEIGAASIVVCSWVAAGSAAVALTGGTQSPVAATLVIAPALALALFGPLRAAEAAGLAVVGYATAAASSAAAGIAYPAVAPGSFAALSLALCGWLLASMRSRAPALRSSAETRRIGEVAHELRTPLNHILGFAQVMREQLFGPLAPRYVEYVDHIIDSARRMNGLATDWLDMARLDAGRYAITKERFDLALLVRDAVDAASLAAAKEHALAHEGADDALPIEADARAVRQILDNLVVNAAKFTPPGGRIVVRLTAGPRAIAIDVLDEGPGFSEEDKRRLARPFERGAGVGAVEGAGLGLTLVKALAQAHGGRLDILDAPRTNVTRGGALMRVLLPAVRGGAGA